MLIASTLARGTPLTTREFLGTTSHATAPMSDIARQVIAQISAVLCEDPQRPIAPDARLIRDLGADSLDCVALVMAIEDRFAIDVPDEDVEELRTVQQLIDYVELAVAIKQRRPGYRLQEEASGHRARPPR